MKRGLTMVAPCVVTGHDPDAAIESRLRELVDGQRALEQRILALEGIEAARTRPTLARADHDVLARLLPAIVGVKGSDLFMTGEAVQLAAVQLVIPNWTAGRLGKLLRRATGIDVEGFVVERMGEEAHAIVWRIVAVLPEFPSSRKSDTAPVLCRGRASSESEDNIQ